MAERPRVRRQRRNDRPSRQTVQTFAVPPSTTDEEHFLMSDHTVPSDAELRERLTSEQYEVTQHKGTERAFTGEYWDCHDGGVYRCVVCDAPLFSSDTKYESGSGWPSFWAPLDDDQVATETDASHGMVRTEALCANCGAHLGHVFPDGPRPTGDRYCMNSASLRLDRDAAPEDAAEDADPE
jgi:peptide-methionine (R)-S-oxide reductase